LSDAGTSRADVKPSDPYIYIGICQELVLKIIYLSPIIMIIRSRLSPDFKQYPGQRNNHLEESPEVCPTERAPYHMMK